MPGLGKSPTLADLRRAAGLPDAVLPAETPVEAPVVLTPGAPTPVAVVQPAVAPAVVQPAPAAPTLAVPTLSPLAPSPISQPGGETPDQLTLPLAPGEESAKLLAQAQAARAAAAELEARAAAAERERVERLRAVEAAAAEQRRQELATIAASIAAERAQADARAAEIAAAEVDATRRIEAERNAADNEINRRLSSAAAELGAIEERRRLAESEIERMAALRITLDAEREQLTAAAAEERVKLESAARDRAALDAERRAIEAAIAAGSAEAAMRPETDEELKRRLAEVDVLEASLRQRADELTRAEARLQTEATNARAAAATAITAAEATASAAAAAVPTEVAEREIVASLALSTAAAEASRQAAAEAATIAAAEERAKLQVQLELEQARRELLELKLRDQVASPFGAAAAPAGDLRAPDLDFAPPVSVFGAAPLPVPILEPESVERFGGILPVVGTVVAVAVVGVVVLLVKDPVLAFIAELLQRGPGAFEDIFRALFGS